MVLRTRWRGVEGGKVAMRRTAVAYAAVTLGALSALAALPALSQQTADPKPAVVREPETPEELQERETRKQCAISLCATLHNRKPDSGQVTCGLQKTWRKDIVTKILARGKVPWPWGNARCMSALKFDRAMLVKAMSAGEFEAQFDKHEISCALAAEAETYDVKLEIHPKVTFKDGKAVKASLNWGKIEGPKVAKAALWSATAADNSFGVLQSSVVEDINDFIQNKCMEVKEAWQGK
jgi:hypothetical protein